MTSRDREQSVEQVAIIGDGQMASVMAMLLAEKRIAVRMWSVFRENIEAMRATRENRRYLPGLRFDDRVSFTTDAVRVFDGADLILSAIPCQFIRPTWQKLRPVAPIDVPIVSVAKGIENETLLRPTQILQEVLGRVPVIALSGPSIATELAKRMPATVVAAADDPAMAELAQRTFATEWFRVYSNTDLLGVELAGATKNVIALAAGIVDGLRAGDNAKAALLARGLVEITRLGVSMGARRETFAGLAGLGDLVTTCISSAGRNRTAGEAIGRGQSVESVIASTASVIEGIPTARSVRELARRHNISMPITEAVHAVLFERKDPIQAVTELMTRDLKHED
ncbi:MAG: NAD(P)-dependent glycerol-3-phosphate dehydrogenase [Phycisphaerae bacterium]|nr:NAD(P)-dependent glycerol-3-phosphate dehydrogenase [Phycisphaerae bacterium]